MFPSWRDQSNHICKDCARWEQREGRDIIQKVYRSLESPIDRLRGVASIRIAQLRQAERAERHPGQIFRVKPRRIRYSVGIWEGRDDMQEGSFTLIVPGKEWRQAVHYALRQVGRGKETRNEYRRVQIGKIPVDSGPIPGTVWNGQPVWRVKATSGRLCRCHLCRKQTTVPGSVPNHFFCIVEERTSESN